MDQRIGNQIDAAMIFTRAIATIFRSSFDSGDRIVGVSRR